MQTQSHFLITALGADTYKQNSSIPLHARALLVGSVLPDLPFWLLTIFGELYFLYVAPLPGIGRGATAMQIMEYLHFDRFFQDPLWIISHNFFHSLIINTLLIGIGRWRSGRLWRRLLILPCCPIPNARNLFEQGNAGLRNSLLSSPFGSSSF